MILVQHEADAGLEEWTLRNWSPARPIDRTYGPIHLKNGLLGVIIPSLLPFIVLLLRQRLLIVQVKWLLFLLLFDRGEWRLKLGVDKVLQLFVHFVSRHLHFLAGELLEVIRIRY